MKSSIIAIALFSAAAAQAQCYQTGSFTSCADGTTYQKSGNTIYGSNSNTGNSWSQTQLGNTTYGTNSQGQTWTQTQSGNSVYGTNSNGKSYYCTKVGAQTICN